MAEGRVLLLTSRGLPQRLLAQRFHRQIGLDGIVVEHRPAPLGGKAAGLKRGLSRLLGRRRFDRLLALKHRLGESALERQLRRLEEGWRRAADERLLQGQGPDPKAWPSVEVLTTPRVNRQEVVQWCRDRRPDLIVVYGTSILKDAMIEVPRLGVLNAHSSILPHYRGVFSEFWQALHGSYDSVGVTVHFIDLGVDTGDIVQQAHSLNPSRELSAEERRGLDPYRLRALNVATTLDIYPVAARSVLHGEETRRAQPTAEAPAFRSRDLTFERRLELLRQLGHPLSSA